MKTDHNIYNDSSLMTLVLIDSGANTRAVISLLRTTCGLSLIEARQALRDSDYVVAKGLRREMMFLEADFLKAGATVELRPHE